MGFISLQLFSIILILELVHLVAFLHNIFFNAYLAPNTSACDPYHIYLPLKIVHSSCKSCLLYPVLWWILLFLLLRSVVKQWQQCFLQSLAHRKQMSFWLRGHFLLCVWTQVLILVKAIADATLPAFALSKYKIGDLCARLKAWRCEHGVPSPLPYNPFFQLSTLTNANSTSSRKCKSLTIKRVQRPCSQ